MNVTDNFKKYIALMHGDISKLHADERENNRRRSELFLDYYEAIVLTFERDIEPVKDMQAQLVEKKGMRVELRRN